MVERAITADCKSAGRKAYVGLNPTLGTMETLEGGLKLLRSAERGITTDRKRMVSPKTADLFMESGTREIAGALAKARVLEEEIPFDLLTEARLIILRDLIKKVEANRNFVIPEEVISIFR